MQTVFTKAIKIILYFPPTTRELKFFGFAFTFLALMFGLLRLVYGGFWFLFFGMICNIIWTVLLIEAFERGK